MATTWSVTGDVPDQYGPSNATGPVLGHVITFITGDGYRGSIFISNDQYNETAIAKALETKAALVHSVNTMTGKA